MKQNANTKRTKIVEWEKLWKIEKIKIKQIPRCRHRNWSFFSFFFPFRVYLDDIEKNLLSAMGTDSVLPKQFLCVFVLVYLYMLYTLFHSHFSGPKKSEINKYQKLYDSSFVRFVEWWRQKRGKRVATSDFTFCFALTDFIKLFFEDFRLLFVALICLILRTLFSYNKFVCLFFILFYGFRSLVRCNLDYENLVRIIFWGLLFPSFLLPVAWIRVVCAINNNVFRTIHRSIYGHKECAESWNATKVDRRQHFVQRLWCLLSCIMKMCIFEKCSEWRRLTTVYFWHTYTGTPCILSGNKSKCDSLVLVY